VSEAIRNIDLWTDRIAGRLPRAGWRRLLEEGGFVKIETGPPVDTFGGACGEDQARHSRPTGMRSLPGNRNSRQRASSMTEQAMRLRLIRSNKP
jgi:hypothetical protein